LLAACSGAETPTDTAAPEAEAAAPATDSTAPEASAAEEAAGGRVFDTVSGSQIDFGSLEGQDTVLWFWAPW
jgi:hypothetical protein